MTRLLAALLLAAVLLTGCLHMGTAGTYITMCDNRDDARGMYKCSTLWVRPVAKVEPMQPAYEWSCVREPGGMRSSKWLQEY